MAKLYLKFNSAVIKEILLLKDETTFGRKPGNDIVIDNPAISGFHGKIIKDGNQFFVEDLNSTNGTFVNGQRIKKHALKDKDQVAIARHVLEYIGDAAPTPVESPSVAPVAAEAPVVADAPVVAKTPVAPPAPSNQMQMLRESLGMSEEEAAKLAPAAASLIKPATSEPVSEKPEAKSDSPAPGQAVIKIIMGGVNGQTEVRLKDLVTYIGSSDQALIKIKGLMAPSLAAAISKRPEGYFLKAVKSGYPKVNGLAVKEQALLENGALIEVGGTNMLFQLSDHKKEA